MDIVKFETALDKYLQEHRLVQPVSLKVQIREDIIAIAYECAEVPHAA